MNNERFPTKISLIRFFMKGSVHWFILGAVFTALVSFFKMVVPKLISFTVDSLIGMTNTQIPFLIRPFKDLMENFSGTSLIAAAAFFVAAAAFLRFLFRFFFNTCIVYGAETFVKKMRDELFNHILSAPFAWMGKNSTGGLIQRCTSDVETVKHFAAEELTGLLRDVSLILFALTFMGSIDCRIMGMCALFIPLIAGLSFFFYGRIGKTFGEAQEQESVLSSIASENLTGVRVIRSFGRERMEESCFQEQNENYTQQLLRVRKQVSVFHSSESFVTGLQTLLTAAAGVLFAVKGQLTSGEYIALISYAIMLAEPEKSIGRLISEMSRAGISLDRLRGIMNSQTETDREHTLKPPMDGDIVFDHVSFGYGQGNGEVLEDVSFTVPGGSVLGILGGTGSGKSTLMYLLTRLYELPGTNGRITIGGVDIADINLQYLRDNLGMVLQEPFLFSRTLSDNIGIAGENVDMDQIRKVAGTAGIDDALGQFEDGYETFVGEQGAALSGGQKQRSAIAQMLIRRPPVMILDDSFSSLDADTDEKIRSRLREEAGSSTVILISHRVKTIMDADHIIVLERGRICEEGTHRDLLSAGGFYRKIYDLQAGGGDL